ncbi:DUF1549 domain-containing protein [Pirellulaceae bacterium SH449]
MNRPNDPRPMKIGNPEEVVFNAVLRDFLCRNVPPALRQRIISEIAVRAQEEQPNGQPAKKTAQLQMSNAELDEALGAAQADVDYANISPPVHIPSSQHGSAQRSQRSYRLEPHFWEYRAVRRLIGLGSLAASLVIAVTLTQTWRNINTENELTAINSNLPPMPSFKELGLDEERAQVEESDRETPTLASIAEANDPPKPAVQKVVHLPKPTRKMFEQPVALEPQKLTEVINSQLRQIWEKHKLSPKLNRDDEIWLTRVTEGILGRRPTFSEEEMLRQQKGDDRYENTVREILASTEFSQHWSKLIAENFLNQPITNTTRRELVSLVSWIGTELEKGTPVGSIERQFIEVGFEESDSKRDAKLALFDDISKRLSAINGEFRSKDAYLLVKGSNQDSRFAHLANSILHSTGNGTASCIQCHSDNKSVLNVIENPNEQVASQFWNFAAAIKIVSSARERPYSELTPKDQEFFYDSNDGQLKLAKGTVSADLYAIGISDGQIEASQMESDGATIHEWIEQSSEARKGLVEAAWIKLMQQPLVPLFKLTEDEADVERRDLKNMLAQQLQATGDLRTIIQAIVLSDAFFVPDAKLTKSWYLSATDNKVSQYNKGTRLFSFVPSDLSRTSLHRPSTTALVAKWTEFDKQRGFSNTALAQPNVRRTPTLPSGGSRNDDEDLDQVRFLLSSGRPYYGLTRLATQLAESKMSWDDKVDHLYLLLKGRYPTRSEHFECKQILEISQQNESKAIVYICTAQLGSY